MSPGPRLLVVDTSALVLGGVVSGSVLVPVFMGSQLGGGAGAGPSARLVSLPGLCEHSFPEVGPVGCSAFLVIVSSLGMW